MPSDSGQHSGSSRLDRLEEGHEKFQHEHNQLLRAQVLLTGLVEKLGHRVDGLAAHMYLMDQRVAESQERALEAAANWDQKMAELREQQKHTDGRLNALISMMDDWIRRQPPPQPN